MDWHTPATVEEYLDAQGTKQVTAINPTINITAEGMSEEVADDRYLAQSANLSDLADPAAAIEALNGDGDLAEFVNDHALGSVTSVSGVEPDGNGNVDLTASDIGAATSAQGSLADTAIQPGDDAGGALGGTFPNPTLNIEAVQDLVAAFIAAGTGINVSYDDTLGSLTFSISDLAITNTFTVASEAAMLALTAQRGDVAVRSDLSSTFILAAEPAVTLGNWVLLPTPTDSVLSVNGQTGAVTISTASIGAVPTTRQVNGHALTGNVTVTRADVGLGNVDDTSDADKPISTATQTALDDKAPLASPALTGTPTAPTADPGTNTTQVATTAFVMANAPSALAFPTFTSSVSTPPASPEVGDTWIPSDFPCLVHYTENGIWQNYMVAVDGGPIASSPIASIGLLYGGVGDTILHAGTQDVNWRLGPTGLSFNDGTASIYAASGTDPSVSGREANVGSILLGNGTPADSNEGRLWLKVGNGDTDWTALSAVANAPSSSSGFSTTFMLMGA